MHKVFLIEFQKDTNPFTLLFKIVSTQEKQTGFVFNYHSNLIQDASGTTISAH